MYSFNIKVCDKLRIAGTSSDLSKNKPGNIIGVVSVFLQLAVDKNDNEEKDDGRLEEEKSPGRGLYDLHYETMDSIGKGAFGFVKMGIRKMDGQEVGALMDNDL